MGGRLLYASYIGRALASNRDACPFYASIKVIATSLESLVSSRISANNFSENISKEEEEEEGRIADVGKFERGTGYQRTKSHSRCLFRVSGRRTKVERNDGWRGKDIYPATA